jgi:hypothetical protein
LLKLRREIGGTAVAVAQRLLALDPLRRPTGRVQAHADAGDLAAALRR